MKKEVYYNFTADGLKYANVEGKIETELKDTRNGFRTIDLVPGIESYLNYLDLLMKYRNRWVNVGYLDLGMIPIIMGPSFLHKSLVEIYTNKLTEAGLKLIPVPAVSFMYQTPTLKNITDYWAFRDDVSMLLAKAPKDVRTKDVFEKVLGRN